jgi:phosphoserine aminotransferase
MSNKYDRIYNFSAGPAMLPESVLERVRDDMLNYRGSGMSVMEMSHRSKEFDDIIARAEASVRSLMKISDDYTVLFLQGGASLQFSMVPMNLTKSGQSVDVIHTGYWTEMALGQLKKGFTHRVLATGEKDGFKKLPEFSADQIDRNAAYAYMCSNNTIEGTQWKSFPDTGSVPLVVDMSSDIFSRKLDFSKMGMIFAGAQKNLGPSGVTLVVMRKDLAERADEKLPTMLQYRTHIKAGSRYNTPPAFGIYTCGLVFDWINEQGGLDGVEKRNAEKAGILYNAIDGSNGFYTCPIDKAARSQMNVVFRIKLGAADGEQIEENFIKEAKKAGLAELKGHRAIGGLRASIYNAFPLEGVKRLSDFMREFQKKHG